MAKRENRKKRNRIEPPEKTKVGVSDKLTVREKKLLHNIANLVTKEKENPTCTSSSSLLSEAGSALFMEYDSETEKLHLWLKSSTGPTIKFLVRPVYTIRAVAASAKRPLISFSKNFVDSENWRIMKSMFTEIFGEGANDAEENPDFVSVFTRRGDFVHFRCYQVLDAPNSSTLEKTLRLAISFPGFVMLNSLRIWCKLTKKLCLVQLCEHICLMAVSFPTTRANQFKASWM